MVPLLLLVTSLRPASLRYRRFIFVFNCFVQFVSLYLVFRQFQRFKLQKKWKIWINAWHLKMLRSAEGKRKKWFLSVETWCIESYLSNYVYRDRLMQLLIIIHHWKRHILDESQQAQINHHYSICTHSHIFNSCKNSNGVSFNSIIIIQFSALDYRCKSQNQERLC